MRSITLEKHDPNWAHLYEREISSLRVFLSGLIVSTHHIGSTAIKGILAKPVIDILIEVTCLGDLEKHSVDFKKLGYEAKGEYGIKGRRFFQKGKKERTHHVHIFESGNPEIERHRLFVEYMNARPDRAADYEALKTALSIEHKDSPESYSQGKSAFIRVVDIEAINSSVIGGSSLCTMQKTT